jgi:hypothetical protein
MQPASSNASTACRRSSGRTNIEIDVGPQLRTSVAGVDEGRPFHDEDVDTDRIQRGDADAQVLEVSKMSGLSGAD